MPKPLPLALMKVQSDVKFTGDTFMNGSRQRRSSRPVWKRACARNAPCRLFGGEDWNRVRRGRRCRTILTNAWRRYLEQNQSRPHTNGDGLGAAGGVQLL